MIYSPSEPLPFLRNQLLLMKWKKVESSSANISAQLDHWRHSPCWTSVSQHSWGPLLHFGYLLFTALPEVHRDKTTCRVTSSGFRVRLTTGELQPQQICKQHAYVYSEPLQTASLFVFSTVAKHIPLSLGLLRAVTSAAELLRSGHAQSFTALSMLLGYLHLLPAFLFEKCAVQ